MLNLCFQGYSRAASSSTSKQASHPLLGLIHYCPTSQASSQCGRGLLKQKQERIRSWGRWPIAASVINSNWCGKRAVCIDTAKLCSLLSSYNLPLPLWRRYKYHPDFVDEQQRHREVIDLVFSRASLRRRQWQSTPVLLPGKFHGRRSLVGCSPWGREESDTTEQLHFHFSLSCIGEGNGSPLQCSCLENPRDGGAWWAAVYGVAQSRTRLNWLSSSSSSSRARLWGFPGGSDSKESACNAGDLGLEDPLEKGMATHSSILVWRILMDRGAMYRPRGHRVGHDWVHTH